MASIYTSNPLEAGESTDIRVLKILHNNTYHASAPISCKIQLITLENDKAVQTPYNALSYVWGSPDATRTILVGGKPFTVRENLWQFLDQMRKVRYSKKIWIDAICINQHDSGEKSHQVAMMGEIYRKATRVEVWLGPTKDGTVRAMQTFSRVKVARRSSWLLENIRLQSLQENIERSIIEKRRDEFAQDLREFGTAEYWTRVWM